MFTTFFKMSSQPFRERIPVEKVINNDQMLQNHARLEYMLHQGDIALVHGPSGVGKSTLIKLFLSRLPLNQYHPLYIHFAHLKTASLFNLIVAALDEVPKQTKDRLFLQIKEKTEKLNLTVILVIDEAHLLYTDTITDLRQLISSPMDDAPALKIVLSGQDAIKAKLKSSSLADFAQRICVDCSLHPLTKTETTSYIDLHLKNASAPERIFQQEVKDAIYEYSAGIPRQINNIATISLINASIQKSQVINLEMLNQTISELQFI